MINFLLKGIIKDKSRSVLPVIVVSIGAALTVILSCWLRGVMGESIEMNANFNTGHLKVMTRAYAKQAEQTPNDLALTGTSELIAKLRSSYTNVDWVQRIRFNGLIDFPDEKGETRVQGPVTGWAVDLISNSSKEKNRLNLSKSLVKGRLPENGSEALLSYELARKFSVNIGDKFTLFGSTMDGSMSFTNFTVSGIVRFGASALDRGAIIIDIKDAQSGFQMQDAAGEILGYFNDGIFSEKTATDIKNDFNGKYKNNKDEFAPLMLSLRDQGGMAEFMDYADTISSIMLFVFVLAMSIVLWNAGLLGGLRRYNEFGVRLALGEEKKHIYKTLVYEAVLIGFIGSFIGTSFGLAISYYIQMRGIDISGLMENSSMLMPSVVRTIVAPASFYIGFIPGLVSMVLGNALSGIGIYKRSTSQLFKELET
ncbi:MAG: FtsX-like permease family protein [Bacteroidota bacterium]|nr:FtsX-like permease family protein [Bacteroidota bacterium]